MSGVSPSEPITAQHLAEYLAEREPDHEGDIAVIFTPEHRDLIVRALKVSTQIAGARKALEEMAGAMDFLLQTKWKSVDRDNMEFEGRVTCYQLDRARAAALSYRSAKT